MAHAYTPGLKVTARATHRVRRTLPIEGDVLVEVGRRVGARDVVARTYMPGDIQPVNVANALSLPPGDVPEAMLVKEGDEIEVGQVLARSKGIFGFFKSEYQATVGGRIESISAVTGQMIVRGDPIPVEVLAYLAGEVVEILPKQGCVVEAEVSFVQGIFGIGGETFGPIRLAGASHEEDLTPEKITAEMKGAVVVGGRRITDEALEKAVKVGVHAVVGGGLDDQDLKEFLGYDLGVAITGSEKKGVTVIVTEGFGEIAMAERTFELFKSREGAEAAVNGATQIRAGVMRPEVLIPWGEAAPPEVPTGGHEAGVLDLGRPVRVIRDPWFGRIGRVSGLPSEPTVLGSGSRARVLTVDLGDGETVTVPRANVELIED